VRDLRGKDNSTKADLEKTFEKRCSMKNRRLMTATTTAILFANALVLAALLAISPLSSAQAKPAPQAPPAPQNRTFLVSGHTGEAPVIQKDGKSYVDIESLARLTNGSLSFKGNQIILTLSPASSAAPPAPQAARAANSAFSKDFLKASVDAMSAIREWREALLTAIQNGTLVTSDFVAPYRAKATNNVRLAFVAVSTDADHNAFQLLNNQMDKMRQLNDKVLAEHENAQNISPDDLKNDPLNQQIVSCARSLVAMAGSGQFQDDGSCH
jgi:hypothetical protein